MADYDVVVLGGGAAGLGASRAALWEGASVALISDAPLGGDCTWTGCVPSKTLIEASRDGSTWERALARVGEVTERIGGSENAETLRGEGADVIEARAGFVGPKTLEIADSGRRVTGTNVMIATGSRAGIPPVPGLDEVPYRTNDSFFEPRPRPDSILVLGGGAIGCELGEAMARFGTRVTIVEYAPRILGPFDVDAAALVDANLRALGVDIAADARSRQVRHDGKTFRLELEDGRTFEADELLVAAGRAPNTERIGLEATGVELDDRGYVVTDRFLRTTVRGVFAVGDVNGKQLLSHAADEMGRVAAWTALRRGRRYAYDPARVPQVVFTTPELAAIGVSETEAPDNARVAEAPMHVNDRALAAERAEGFVRLVARRDWLTGHAAGGKLIGATIVGGHAGELINECALVMRSNTYAGRLAQTVRAYPSWSTIMQKTAARWFYEIEGEGARPPRR